MAKRYYLSPVAFDAARSENVIVLADLLRGTNHVARFCTPNPDPTTGRITAGWALCMVETPIHASLIRDERIVALPEAALDAKLNSIRTQTLNGMNTALEARGFNVGAWSNSDALFDVVGALGRQIAAGFDPVSFDLL